jgi:hypothetical protein
VSLNIPIYGQVDLPWSFFLLQAARGSVRVPEWVERAVPAVVAARVAKKPEDVDEDDLNEALALLPEDPSAVLWRLLLAMDSDLPDHGQLMLDEAQVLGSFRPAVGQVDLLRDVATMMMADYSPEAFRACLASIEGDAWDARGAVAAMVYLLLIHHG